MEAQMSSPPCDKFVKQQVNTGSSGLCDSVKQSMRQDVSIAHLSNQEFSLE